MCHEGLLSWHEKRGQGKVISTTGFSLFQVDRESTFGVIAQRGEGECADEFGVVDHIKSFGKINCLGQCVEWGTGLTKGWDGSHVGWEKEEVSEVPVAESVLTP